MYRDHCTIVDGTLLHWLFPSKELHDGLRILVNDKGCQYMSKCIVEGGVADIYVEDVFVQALLDEDEGRGVEASGFEDEWKRCLSEN